MFLDKALRGASSWARWVAPFSFSGLNIFTPIGMKYLYILLVIPALFCGCGNQDSTQLATINNHLTQIQNEQVELNHRLDAVKAQLDAMPTTMSKICYYYSTNETSQIFACHTTVLNAMAGQEDSIETTINNEIKRLVSGNEKILELKLNESVSDIKGDNIIMKADLQMIKIKLGIPY